MGSYAGISNKVRKEVYRRDGYMCTVCGNTTYLQIHHYCPRGQGGNDTPHNLVTLCSTCHGQIHGLIPFEGQTVPEPFRAGIDIYPNDPYTKDDMEQAITEYLADYYAPDWWPYK